jgi:hypothetical protein
MPTTTPTPPLNMPVGSVRSIVTLSVLGTVWTQLLRGFPTSEILHDTLLLVLGYYFGARGAKPAIPAAQADPANVRRDTAHPLYLPKGSIRSIIILGFAVIVGKLALEGTLLGPHGVPPVLVLAGTFLVGTITKVVLGWLWRVLPTFVQSGFGHVVAASTLAVVATYCFAVVFGEEANLPPAFESVFLGAVGFYLGER